MRIERIPNFISEKERGTLLQWMKDNEKNPEIFGWGTTSSGADTHLRRTTRRVANKVPYPNLAFDIQSRIRDSFSFTPKSVIEHVGGGPGMICVVHYPGGETNIHKDHILHPTGRHGIRFNIVLQNSEGGGLLTVGDKTFLPEERELHCYAATNHYHQVEKVTGNNNRYIWIFGFSCPIEDWEEGVIRYLR